MNLPRLQRRRLILAADYTNAATVEFIVDKDGKYYFIEVNARASRRTNQP